MPKTYLYSVRNYGLRKATDEYEHDKAQASTVVTKMLTRSVFKPGLDVYECLPPWNQGVTKRMTCNSRSGGGKDKRREAGQKSYHHLSLVTRFLLGLRMTRLRASAQAKRSMVGHPSGKENRMSPGETEASKKGKHVLPENRGDQPLHNRPQTSSSSQMDSNEGVSGEKQLHESNIVKQDSVAQQQQPPSQDDLASQKVTPAAVTSPLSVDVQGCQAHGDHPGLQVPSSSPKNSQNHQTAPSTTSMTKTNSESQSHQSSLSPCRAVSHEEEFPMRTNTCVVNLSSSENDHQQSEVNITAESKDQDIVAIGSLSSTREVQMKSVTAFCKRSNAKTMILPQDKDSLNAPIAACVGNERKLLTSGGHQTISSNGEKDTPDTGQVACDQPGSAMSQHHVFQPDRSHGGVDNGNWYGRDDGSLAHQQCQDKLTQCEIDIRRVVTKAKEGNTKEPSVNWQTITQSPVGDVANRHFITDGNSVVSWQLCGDSSQLPVSNTSVGEESSGDLGNSNLTDSIAVFEQENVASTKVKSLVQCSQRAKNAQVPLIHTNQIRVATFGKNIPVFLTTHGAVGPAKDVEKTIRCPPDHLTSHCLGDQVKSELRQNKQGVDTYGCEKNNIEDIENTMKPVRSIQERHWESRRMPSSSQTFEITASEYAGSNGKNTEMFVSTYGQYVQQEMLQLSCKDIQDSRPVSGVTSALTATNHTDPSIGSGYYAFAQKDYFPGLTRPVLEQHQIPLNRTPCNETARMVCQIPAPAMFNPLQASSGQAAVFLSPSLNFNKPMSTPKITSSRTILPMIGGDGAPYLTTFSTASGDALIVDNTRNHGEASPSNSLTLYNQMPWDFSKSSLSDATGMVQLSPNQQLSAFSPSATPKREVTASREAASLYEGSQASATYLLLGQQRKFATPALDLLNNVAKTPSVSAGDQLQMYAPNVAGPTVEQNSSFLVPYFGGTMQTLGRVESTDASLTKTTMYPGLSCIQFSSSKDHGYNRLSVPKRQKNSQKYGLASSGDGELKRPTPGMAVHANNTQAGYTVHFDQVNSDFSSFANKPVVSTNVTDNSQSSKITSWCAVEDVNMCQPRVLTAQDLNVYGTDGAFHQRRSENRGTLNASYCNDISNYKPASSDTILTSNVALRDDLRNIHAVKNNISGSNVNNNITTTTSSGGSNSSRTKPARLENMCPICCRLFSRMWLLKGHMRTHTGERPYQCSQPNCHKAFADRSNLRSHMLTHTAPAKSFTCPRCSRTFSQKRYLHKHLTEVCKVSTQG